MTISGKKEAIFLFVGDILVFFISLWFTLLIRYGNPSGEIWSSHAVPFSILFGISVVIFFIAGLYERHTTILKKKIPGIILNAQIANAVIAVLFFYLIPYFGIAPKTNLFIYIIISFFLVMMWRLHGPRLLGVRTPQNALLIGSGEEMKELRREVNDNNQYPIRFVSSIDLNHIESLDFQTDILNTVYSEGVTIVVADLQNDKVAAILPNLYNLIFSKVRFVDMHKIYEDIFNRIPLSLVRHNWFLENISIGSRTTNDAIKNISDKIVAFAGLILTLVIYPIVYVLVKTEDGGSLFFFQERTGQNNKKIKIVKFRSMKENEDGTRTITKVGKLIRNTRVDELPQLWNVFKGELSLIGPRPEIPEYVKEYEEQIPYYNIRHLVKPGLSGWAQIYHENHPHHSSNVDETKIKLSYDLFYVKNRSFFLDLKISLKTLKTLISRSGR